MRCLRGLKEFGKRLLKSIERFPVDAVTRLGSVDFAFNQACLQEFLQVLGYRRLCQGQHIDNFPADAGLPGGDLFQDGYPCRVTDGIGKIGQCIFFFVEFVLLILGHEFKVYRKYTIK